MDHTRDCIAILVTASGEGRSTLEGAIKARELTLAKVEAQQDVVRGPRLKYAQSRLTVGMKVLFHQGGSPAKFEGKVPNVGRLVAAGRLDSVNDIGNLSLSAGVDQRLLSKTLEIFPGAELIGLLEFRDVVQLTAPRLTKSLLERPPLPSEHYIVMCPSDPRCGHLESMWRSAHNS